MNQGMSLVGVDQNWIKIVKGLVLLIAVVFDIVTKNKAAKKTPKAKSHVDIEKAIDEAVNEVVERASESADEGAVPTDS